MTTASKLPQMTRQKIFKASVLTLVYWGEAAHLRYRCRSNVAVTDASVEIWQIELDDPVLVMPQRRAWLDEHELRTASSFAHEIHARRYTAAHTSVRDILARALGRAPDRIIIERSSHGRPALKHDSVDFNITHSGNVCLVAVSACRQVGIDLEYLEQPLDSATLDIIAHPSERKSLNGCNDRMENLLLWVAKEAALKADGRGFMKDPRTILVHWQANRRYGLAVDTVQSKTWRLTKLDVGTEWIAALATQLRCATRLQIYKPDQKS